MADIAVEAEKQKKVLVKIGKQNSYSGQKSSTVAVIQIKLKDWAPRSCIIKSLSSDFVAETSNNTPANFLSFSKNTMHHYFMKVPAAQVSRLSETWKNITTMTC